MGFDTVTFLAQIVNLAILIWLLKRFLYRPIIQAVDKRQAYIHQKIQEATDEKLKWENETALLKQRKKEFERQKQESWNLTLSEQEAYRKEQQKALKNKRLQSEKQIQKEIQLQKERLTEQLQSIASECVLDLMKRLTSDFALDTSVDNNLGLFEKALQKVPKSHYAKMKEALQENEKMLVLTAVSLSKEQKEKLKKILEKAFKTPDISLQIKQNKELVFGFQIQVKHLTIDWNIKTYFDELHQQLHQKTTHLIEEK